MLRMPSHWKPWFLGGGYRTSRKRSTSFMLSMQASTTWMMKSSPAWTVGLGQFLTPESSSVRWRGSTLSQSAWNESVQYIIVLIHNSSQVNIFSFAVQIVSYGLSAEFWFWFGLGLELDEVVVWVGFGAGVEIDRYNHTDKDQPIYF